MKSEEVNFLPASVSYFIYRQKSEVKPIGLVLSTFFGAVLGLDIAHVARRLFVLAM